MATRDNYKIQLHRILDVFLSVLAFWIAFLIRDQFLATTDGLATSEYIEATPWIVIIWYGSFAFFNLHSHYVKYTNTHHLRRLAEVLIINFALLILCLYVVKVKDISRLVLALFFAIDFVFLSLSQHISMLGGAKYPINILIVIIGSKEAAREFIEFVSRNPDNPCRIAGCLDLDQEYVGKIVANDISVMGTIEQLQDFLSREVVDEIVFAMPIDKIQEAQRYFAIAEAVGVQIRILPHWYLRKFLATRPKFYSIAFEGFFDYPTLLLTPTPFARGSLLVKTALDYLLAFLGLLCSMPLFLPVILAVKIASPGPGFYKQQRCGLYGRKFNLYKFRTMVVDADTKKAELRSLNESDEPAFKIRNDPRIIPGIGFFLRKRGLDELPNLFNVLRGEMSIVGPRPPTPDEVVKYEPRERRRLSMKPGLTGLWQITPDRNAMSFEKWMELDLQYIDNWSLWLDFRIMLATVKAVLLGYGA